MPSTVIAGDGIRRTEASEARPGALAVALRLARRLLVKSARPRLPRSAQALPLNEHLRRDIGIDAPGAPMLPSQSGRWS